MCLSISALFTKIYRINRVFQCAKAFQRVKITPLDVAKPLAFLMIINCALLAGMTAVAPLVWVREVTDYDIYGRPTNSYGSCRPQENTLYFLIPLVIVGFSSLLAANYQSYLARNLPSRWNESLYISLTNFILLETTVITLPVSWGTWTWRHLFCVSIAHLSRLFGIEGTCFGWKGAHSV